MREGAARLLTRLRCEVDPDTPVADLSVAEQQLVEVARALRRRARLLVMDEPTAALSDAESDALFDVIRSLCREGVPVIYISHRMKDIFAIVSRIRAEGTTVLLVEQNARSALQIADRGYVLETGRIVLQGTAEELLQNRDVQRAYLGSERDAEDRAAP